MLDEYRECSSIHDALENGVQIMFLSYLALAILIIVIIAVVYGFIWIHDIPYNLAKKRNHPNLHTIHIACWLSLFTLHALWPFIFIWAIAQKPRFEVIIVGDQKKGLDVGSGGGAMSGSEEPAALRQAIRELTARLDALEKRNGGKEARHG